MNAMFCGSFDPITLGHISVINQALSHKYGKDVTLDKLIICVSQNNQKNSLFSAETRKEMIEDAFKNHPLKHKIEVAINKGLTVDFAKKHNVTTLIRGIRQNSNDLKQEKIMAKTNQNLASIRGFNLETIFITITDDNLASISSTLVKDLCILGEYIAVASLVPENVHNELMCIFLEPRFTKLFFDSSQSTAYMNWRELTQAYKIRPYHNMSHLGYMFNMLDIYQTQTKTSSSAEFEISIFGHDYVYDATRNDNEARSIKSVISWIGKRYYKSSQYLEELIMATTHNNDDLTDDKALIADLDLSILGTFNPKTWKTYCQNIRREYSHLSDSEFAKGRLEFFQKILERKRIFQTDFFYDLFEKQACKNIKEEIKNLNV